MNKIHAINKSYSEYKKIAFNKVKPTTPKEVEVIKISLNLFILSLYLSINDIKIFFCQKKDYFCFLVAFLVFLSSTSLEVILFSAFVVFIERINIEIPNITIPPRQI